MKLAQYQKKYCAESSIFADYLQRLFQLKIFLLQEKFSRIWVAINQTC